MTGSAEADECRRLEKMLDEKEASTSAVIEALGEEVAHLTNACHHLSFQLVMANVQPDHLKFGEPPISTTRLVSTDEDDKQKHVSSKPVKAALKGESRFLEIERAPDALQCFATGSGLATAIADRETGFEIVTYKLKGGHIDAIDVTITHDWKNNECKLPAKLHDNGDGSYSVKYEPTMHGVLKVCIQIEEVTIPRSPFFVQVKQRGSI